MKKCRRILMGCALVVCLMGCSANSKPASAPESTEAVSMEETALTNEPGEEGAMEETVPADESEEVESAEETATIAHEIPEDGIYTAEFKSDSSMFHVNEACEGRGTLTVVNGEMMIHISLASKKIVNLYYGLADDAKEDEEHLLMPTEDEVTYSDGMTEVVYGFDVPVPGIGEEFDLALIGTHGNWYDHKVIVKDPVPVE